jgi:hypothetical protein
LNVCTQKSTPLNCHMFIVHVLTRAINGGHAGIRASPSRLLKIQPIFFNFYR